MPPRQVDLRGADDFLRLSKALKRAGKTELRKELNKTLKQAVKPMLPLAAKALAEAMPTASPLAKEGAHVKQVVLVKTGRNPGVTIGVRWGNRNIGLGASNARRANHYGVVRHPLFGNREKWFNTPVPRALGWFDNTHARNAPLVLPALDQAVQNIADKVVKEAQGG